MRRLLLVAAVVFSVSCANPRHVAVVADSTLYQILSTVHAAEQTVLCGQPSCAGVTTTVSDKWTVAQSQAFNKKFEPAVESGRALNGILATWKPGQPLPAQVQALISSLADSITAITSDFPDGTTKTTILANIGRAQSIVLQALSFALAPKGA